MRAVMTPRRARTAVRYGRGRIRRAERLAMGLYRDYAEWTVVWVSESYSDAL